MALDTGDGDRKVRAVRRTLVGKIVVGELTEHGRGVRAPEAERADLLGEVGEGHRTVVGHVLADPELVAATVEDAGDDADAILGHPHHGEVGVEATVLVEPRGIDRAADRHIDFVDGEVVGELDGAGALEFVDLEGAEVDQTAVLAKVEMLPDGDRVPPAVVPLDGALFEAVALDEVGVRGVPLRALPDASLEELGAEGFLAALERRLDQVATRLPLLGGVDDAVGLVEVLRRASPDVLVALLLVIEAGYIGAVGVDDAGVAVGHPLGDDLRHAGTFLDPDGGGGPEVLDIGKLTETRHGVGGE